MLRGLYAITPDWHDTARLAAGVRAAIAGGAAAVQYRNKTASPALQRTQASTLLAITRQAGIPLIVNDDVTLTLEIGADGVHLGRDDADVATTRRQLGPQRLVGVSCYDEIERAAAAQAAGAGYVAFGSVFSSTVKPSAVRAPLALFTAARQRCTLPIVAIGGITVANAPTAIAAGADALAVISALFDAPDVTSAAAAFAQLFAEAPA